MDFERLYKFPNDSFFLLGPRGVGKSTLIRKKIKANLHVDLLDSRRFLELKRDPGVLGDLCRPLKKGAIVCIDEIQKIPLLLDEVHKLIEENKLRFVLTGSSARKLKNNASNLLAGRALTKKMFPFSLKELANHFKIERLLEIGTLPVVLNRAENAESVLASYVDTYLREEIREEALSRNIGDFSRFLEISGQMQGRILNFENVARESGRSGDTIKSWYQILEETLLGATLPSFRPGYKTREVSHSKFYYADCGVARAAAGLGREAMDPLSKGFAFESIVLNELKIYNEIKEKNNKISFYGVTGDEEIDFIVETQKKTIDRPERFISLEVKASTKWKRDFEGPSRALFEAASKKHVKMYGVYLGRDEILKDNFHVLPLNTFVQKLFEGSIY